MSVLAVYNHTEFVTRDADDDTQYDRHYNSSSYQDGLMPSLDHNDDLEYYQDGKHPLQGLEDDDDDHQKRLVDGLGVVSQPHNQLLLQVYPLGSHVKWLSIHWLVRPQSNWLQIRYNRRKTYHS